MQGLREGNVLQPSHFVNKMNLGNLRKSLRWAGPTPTERTEALQERLEELLVFELHKDGGSQYLTLSVRGLYRHVLSAITNRKDQINVDLEEIPKMPNATSNDHRQTLHDLVTSPYPLGLANITGEEASETQVAQRRVTFQAPSFPKPSKPKRNRSVSIDTTGKDPARQRSSEITYRERLGGYLHPRDMRRLVTPFSASNEPALLVRRHVMLLNFDPLRAIILRDRLLVLVPDGADSLLVKVERRVRGGAAEVEDSIFGGGSSVNSASDEKDIGDTLHSNNSRSSDEKQRKAKKSLLSKIIGRHSSKSDDCDPISSESGKAFEASQSTPSETTELEDAADSEEDDSQDADEWDEMEGREWIDLPFELQCADACLNIVCELLTDDTKELQEATVGYIHRIITDHGVSDDPLTIIRAIKDATREMNARVKGFVQSMNRILDEDEDMALMNLSRLLTHPERFIQPVPQSVLEEESDESELLLESHLQTSLTLMNSLDLIQGQIDTAAELVDQKLDSARNKILFANMLISVLSLCVASVSLVGSLFGMNLLNYLEDDPNAFRQVTYGGLAGGVVLGMLIMLVLIYSGTIPRFRLTSSDPANL
jgi:hypothetical protein